MKLKPIAKLVAGTALMIIGAIPLFVLVHDLLILGITLITNYFSFFVGYVLGTLIFIYAGYSLAKNPLKTVILKLKGYKNPEAYWNLRWKLDLEEEKWSPQAFKKMITQTSQLMKEHRCKNVLDVGCGEAKLRSLEGYVGLDRSEVPLKKSGLQNYLVGDIANPNLNVPDKSFDAVMTRFVLLHIPPNHIETAAKNISRIAKKLVMLREPTANTPTQTASHCYAHNLEKLFKNFEGTVVFLE